jgi:hypothetical protein
MAAQLTLTKTFSERRERLWMARAISSLPVPVSPAMRTVESVGATFVTLESTAWSTGDAPTISRTSTSVDAWRSATACPKSVLDRLRSSMSIPVSTIASRPVIVQKRYIG